MFTISNLRKIYSFTITFQLISYTEYRFKRTCGTLTTIKRPSLTNKQKKSLEGKNTIQKSEGVGGKEN